MPERTEIVMKSYVRHLAEARGCSAQEPSEVCQGASRSGRSPRLSVWMEGDADQVEDSEGRRAGSAATIEANIPPSFPISADHSQISPNSRDEIRQRVVAVC